MVSLGMCIGWGGFRAEKSREGVQQRSKKCASIEKGFDHATGGTKVIRCRFPVRPSTKGEWGLRFDSFLAQALELGPLGSEDPELSPALVELTSQPHAQGRSVGDGGDAGGLLLCQQDGGDSDWVGAAGSERRIFRHHQLWGVKYLRQIPETILERSRNRLWSFAGTGWRQNWMTSKKKSYFRSGFNISFFLKEIFELCQCW